MNHHTATVTSMPDIPQSEQDIAGVLRVAVWILGIAIVLTDNKIRGRDEGFHEGVICVEEVDLGSKSMDRCKRYPFNRASPTY